MNNFKLYQNYLLHTVFNTEKDYSLDKINIRVYQKLVLDQEFFLFLKEKFRREESSPFEGKSRNKALEVGLQRVISQSPNPVQPLNYGYFNKQLKCGNSSFFSANINKNFSLNSK